MWNTLASTHYETISVNKISATKLQGSRTSTAAADNLELSNDCHHLINSKKKKEAKGDKANLKGDEEEDANNCDEPYFLFCTKNE